MAFVPKLFVSIGKDQHFFTLRETYQHTTYLPGPGGNAVVNGVYQGTAITETRSFHHFNLSQDADEAWQKAQETSERFGLPLMGSREEMVEEMAAIKRATAEQLAAREAERIAWQEERKAERAAELARKIDQINSGVFAFGPFVGEKFVDAKPSYLEWFVDKRDDFEADSLPRLTADAIVRFASHRLPIKPDPAATIGEVGKRLDVEVTVTRQFTFQRDRFNAWGTETVFITTMITPDRVCVVVKSTSFSPDVGETLKLRGTVKAHTEYKGQMQTILQRVKVL
ncbi:hypothetical protein EVC29_023 [Rhizobium phage RHph_Y52]|nr:hypothetical protein EVC16_023 [Rhizobium phage RHph_Y21]QIG76724.1 hypothetical protein EVC29_023 [Rhizobium phage RHph_Y52]